jgi:hypothetical protein
LALFAIIKIAWVIFYCQLSISSFNLVQRRIFWNS